MSNQVYGEILSFSAVNMIKRILPSAKCFLDIGAGKGSLICKVAQKTSLQVLGVEINPNHELEALENISQLKPCEQERIRYIRADILLTSLPVIDCAYVCSTAFSLNLQIDLTKYLCANIMAKQLFTLRPLPDNTFYVYHGRFPVECSWDSAMCYEYRSRDTYVS